MTNPTPISQHRPQDGEFTPKDDLENVPLVITSAKTAKGKQGMFWICQAARQDTGEAVVFSGSKVINELMANVQANNAFPVAAMIVKVKGDNPQGFYWDLQDWPEGTVLNGDAPTPEVAPAANGDGNRVAQIGAYIERRIITVDDVGLLTKEITGESKKVNDLDDTEYAALLERIAELESSIDSEPPF